MPSRPASSISTPALFCRMTGRPWRKDSFNTPDGDEASGHLFVACSAKLEVLSAGADGAVLSSIDTGDGVDDFDYAAKPRLVYVGAARAGTLTIARDDASGHLTPVATVPTAAGARNPAVTP